MKHIIIFLGLLTICHTGFGQATVYPARAQNKAIAILGATIHTGTGQVIENGYITFDQGKITGIGDARVVKFNTNTYEMINAGGKHIYPGFISPVTDLGLIETSSIRATLDNSEVGNLNPHIRSIIAYNTDSKIPNTLRTNGILLAHITPQGGLISGQSSVVELDGWNWEDAAYKTDLGIHMNWPSSQISSRPNALPVEMQKENSQKAFSELERYFAEARAYSELSKPDVSNSRFNAMKGLFNNSKKLFVNAQNSKDIIAAVNFFKKMGINPVIAGAREAHLISSFLKDNNISLIINEPHALPSNENDDVYLPYKQAKMLSDAGINFAISIDGYWQQRNLPFMAGTAAAYGLSKEQALASITLNTAKILGIDKTVGSLEIGKDATLFISAGDALDMMSNDVEQAFIRGKNISLDNLHKQLFKRYSEKYEGK
ncbi:amidohydrolase family protein [Daejeonella oryzae]|uniref:amidohydrolase family protein n=1 Tax=Daejeonella oryzae TaxID=1122943 RepID=UPI000423E45B|nr:amidohydrolase family protein [Daejeonella oryzae]